MGHILGDDARGIGPVGISSSFTSGLPGDGMTYESAGRRRDGSETEEGGRRSFDAFAAELGRELAPRGVLEGVLADCVILSAWTLQSIADEEFSDARNCFDSKSCVESSGDALAVTHGLEKALEVYRRVREGTLVSCERPALEPVEQERPADANRDARRFYGDEDTSDLSNEWPIVPRGRRVEGDLGDTRLTTSDDASFEVAERWRDRLVYDTNVSERYPVVKGTWVSVGHVVGLIVDGWSWSDILRTHPELVEDDIRTCLAYSVAEDDADF
jgi:uncharacterized protein (DUF433 family)